MRLALFCRKVTHLAAALLLISSLGCATLQPKPVIASPNAPLYTYLIIHGIARGAFITGTLHSNDLDHVIALDHTARQTVENALKKHLQHHDSAPNTNDIQATKALSDLLSYIER
ncbi:hypothetical protein [Neokomagataea anthophila]|uniref:Uncharacterized protein n=1 Tax=Neokomagataea anthophila TaxID=2826925 RepID=A0ABS5E6X5_9PROT|nr:hypothetical protein [Neokomagataea anthophila]MBR0559650.1 hypothetical protein [Neokomagataea anthophila]